MILAAAIAAILAFLYVYLLSRRVDLGFASLLAVDLYYFTFGLNASVLGGVHLDPHDAVLISLLAAGLIRTSLRLRGFASSRLLAFGFVMLLGMSVARGVFSIRVLSVFNEARGFTGVLIALLYFATAPTDEQSLRRYVNMYLCFGAALCVVAGLAALGLPVGMGATLHLTSSEVDGRYLPASAAAAIAVCAFLSLVISRYWKNGVVSQVLPAIFFSVAIYLRHRTVWVMLLVGLAALLPLDPKLFRRLLPIAAAASLAVFGLALYGSHAEGFVGEGAFAQSATDTGTWQWRVQGWEDLLSTGDQSLINTAFGQPMGSGFYRILSLSDIAVDVAPHSEYVQEYLRVGVIGLVLLLMFLLKAFARLWKLSKTRDLDVYPTASAWSIVFLIMFVFGITYNLSPHSYALIGIGIAVSLRPDLQIEADYAHEALGASGSASLSSGEAVMEC